MVSIAPHKVPWNPGSHLRPQDKAQKVSQIIDVLFGVKKEDVEAVLEIVKLTLNQGE